MQDTSDTIKFYFKTGLNAIKCEESASKANVSEKLFRSALSTQMTMATCWGEGVHNIEQTSIN